MAGKHELEKFEYLFVDIEWNQTPETNGIEDREPIQIGVVATDESMNLKKSFSGTMRLSSEEKYNPDTLVLSHSTLKSVMQANSEEIVLRKIKMSFPKYKYVVVWTKDTYELFKRGMDTYGYSMPRHRVIVFQEVLMHIASDGVNQIGFERALKQAGIEYQKNFLHYSKHDANYMYHLFCKDYCELQGLDYTLFLSLLRQLDFERVQFVKPMEQYSEGQKKKVLIAASLLTSAHLYIWDEPLNYIDVFTRMQIEKLIETYRPTMLLVEHDVTFKEKIANKVIRL